MAYIIYKTVNKITGEYYIGKTCTQKESYLGSGYRIKRQVAVYGKENFERYILSTHKSDKEVCEEESRLVNYKTLSDPKCLNIVEGGSKVQRFTHQIISDAHESILSSVPFNNIYTKEEILCSLKALEYKNMYKDSLYTDSEILKICKKLRESLYTEVLRVPT